VPEVVDTMEETTVLTVTKYVTQLLAARVAKEAKVDTTTVVSAVAITVERAAREDTTDHSHSKNVKSCVMITNHRTNHLWYLITHQSVIQVPTANTIVAKNRFAATRIVSRVVEARVAKEEREATMEELDSVVTMVAAATTVEREEKEERVDTMDSKHVKSFAKVISIGMACTGTIKITHLDTVVTQVPGIITCTVETVDTVDTLQEETAATSQEETAAEYGMEDMEHGIKSTTTLSMHHPHAIILATATATTAVTNHPKKTATKSVSTSVEDTTVARVAKEGREDTTVELDSVVTTEESPVEAATTVEREEKVEKEERVETLDTKLVKQSVNLLTTVPCHITDKFCVRTALLWLCRSLFM